MPLRGCLLSILAGDSAAQPADSEIRVLQQRHCPDCRLADADLVHADLRDAHLAGARLQRANLGEARLDGADLSGSDLSFTSLRGASLRGADLRGSRLSDLTQKSAFQATQSAAVSISSAAILDPGAGRQGKNDLAGTLLMPDCSLSSRVIRSRPIS